MFNIETVKFSGVILFHIFSQKHPLQALVMGISGLQEGADVAFQWILGIIFVVSCWRICGPQELKYICTVLQRCWKTIWHDPGRRKDSMGQILISNLIWKNSVTKTANAWHTRWHKMFIMDKRSCTTFSHSGATNTIERDETFLYASVSSLGSFICQTLRESHWDSQHYTAEGLGQLVFLGEEQSQAYSMCILALLWKHTAPCQTQPWQLITDS